MYDDFTLFGEYSTAWQAHIIKNLLEENGIRVVFENPNMTAIFPLPSITQLLFVPTVDLERAYELLQNKNIGEEINEDKFDDFAENMGYDDKDSRFEDYAIVTEYTNEFAQPEKNIEEYQDYEVLESDEAVDGPYYQKYVKPAISKELVTAKVDDEFDSTKAYLCPICKDTYLKKTDTPYGMKFLYSMNYIVLLMQIVAKFGVLNKTMFTENIGLLLPLNVIIVIIHIFSLLTSRFSCEKCGHDERH